MCPVCSLQHEQQGAEVEVHANEVARELEGHGNVLPAKVPSSGGC